MKSKVLILSFFLAAPLAAQTRFEEMVTEDFWLQGRNVNGVRMVPAYSGRSALSFVEAGAGFAAGGDGPDRGAGLRAGSLLHLPKTSLLGTLAIGERRSGPDDGSFRTAFSGGVTTALGDRWSLGGTVRFASAGHEVRGSVEPAVLYRGASGRAGMCLILGKGPAWGAAVQGSLMEQYSGEAAWIRSRSGADGLPENRVSLLLEYRRGGMLTHWTRLRYEGRFFPDGSCGRLSASYRAVTHRRSGLETRIGYSRTDRPAAARPGGFDAGLSCWHTAGPWRITLRTGLARSRTDLLFLVRRTFRRGVYVQAEGGLARGPRTDRPEGGTRPGGGLRFGVDF